MNNAELIVRTLKKAGVQYGFGIPSGNVLPLMEAMRAHDLPFVLTAHEGSAGFAADVMGRMTGAPGLGIATLGPGATNLATGVGNAWLDRSPMIAITCNLNVDQLGRRIQMYIDHHQLFAPITKATLPLRKGSVAGTVAEAVKIAMSEPRGPVHLDLPEDVALAAATEDIPDFPALDRIAPADRQSIEAGLQILSGAKRPVAVIGSNAMRMEDADLLRAFIERHGIPFATTTMAKGMIDEDNPWSAGCIERGKRQMQRDFLRDSDLIVGIGYDTIEVEYEAWIGDTPLLQVDIEKVDVAPSVNLKGEVTGNLDASLAALAGAPEIPNEWSEGHVAAHRSSFQEALRPRVRNFAPHQAIDIVRDVLPDNGILTFDVGAHTHQIASQWTAHAPKEFHITNGWSSMGVRPAVGNCGETRAAGPAGRVRSGRRLFPDDLWRTGDRQTAGDLSAGGGAGRPLARPDPGQAGTPPVADLRHRVAGRRIPRPAGALFRRAGRRRPRRRRSAHGAGKGAAQRRPHGHRGDRRCGSLFRYGL